MTTIIIKDNLRAAVEAASGGHNTVLYDDLGQPSYMHVFTRSNLEDSSANVGTGIEPAFVINGVEKSEIFIGQYLAVVLAGRACSLPGLDPAASLTFDTAKGYCDAKGAGWHIMTNAEWALVQRLCWANGTMPSGNNNYGRDVSTPRETGIRQDGLAPGLASGTARTLTGSGPATWRHDGTIFGVADFAGLVWEMAAAGYRLVDGEIQIVADNDAAVTGADLSATSALWQAVDGTGALVAPGTAGTMKFNASNADGSGVAVLDNIITNSSDGTTYTYNTFESVGVDGINVLAAPDRLKQLGIFPADAGLGGDGMWMRNLGERFPIRGGTWNTGGTAGVFAVNLNYPRTTAHTNIGFRPAFAI